MTLLELKWYAEKMIKIYRDKLGDSDKLEDRDKFKYIEENIIDIFKNASDDINNEGSEYHECELAAESIRQFCNEQLDED